MPYRRPHQKTLEARLDEPPTFMIVVAGPRQIGKSTMVRAALAGRPATFEAADLPAGAPIDPFSPAASIIQAEPGAKATEQWIIDKWIQARTKARALPPGQYHVLAIDEVQKIPRWSEVVKGLWDADRAENVPLHVVLLGSSPWLMQRGLTESLAGRYEPIYMSHWGYREMHDAFDFSLDEYIYFGGYPGAAPLIRDENRWRQYVRNALITPNIECDILQMTRVEKPALLKNLFEQGCGAYSGQIVALTKLLGQLLDAGNTVTLAHYLDLLSQAGLLTGLQKYAGQELRRRAAPPKFNAHNTALISAQAGYTFQQAKNDRTYWGRLVESAVGSHLINNKPENSRLYYWRESPSEVDFVLRAGEQLLAIEVKSGDDYAAPKGLAAFAERFKHVTPLVVGADGVSISDFLLQPVASWMN
jgi:predicted AAA+ superfamily ATPase